MTPLRILSRFPVMFDGKITLSIAQKIFWSKARKNNNHRYNAQNDSHLIIGRLRIFLNLNWFSNNQMQWCRERDVGPVLQCAI